MDTLTNFVQSVKKALGGALTGGGITAAYTVAAGDDAFAILVKTAIGVAVGYVLVWLTPANGPAVNPGQGRK